MTNPYLISTPFSDVGNKDEILESSSVKPNDPTWLGGFPVITSTPIAEGGFPPKRVSFNGVLNAITQNIVHQSKGLMYEFDSAYATKIGGYPLNARLALSNGDVVVSTIANNTNNPNSDMTGWVKTNSASQIFDASGVTQQEINDSAGLDWRSKPSGYGINDRVRLANGELVRSIKEINTQNPNENMDGWVYVDGKSHIRRFMTLADVVSEGLNPNDFDWHPVFNRAGNSKQTILVPYKPTSYKLSTAFEVKDGTFFEGDGRYAVLETTGTNKRIAYADGGESAGFRNLHIKGNLTGLGSTSAGSSGGDGLFFSNMQYPVVEKCYFSDIGNTASSFASSIYLYRCSKHKIHNNVFLSGQSTTGADIQFGYYCSESDIVGNISFSEHDTFISGAAVGTVESETVNHNINNNMGFRSAATVSRSGIILPYDGKPAYGNVSNNIMVGFLWNGVYVSAGATPAGNKSAGLNIFGNIIRYCGGAAGNISSGIYLAGRNGINCFGNLVENTGYAVDGTKRVANVSGLYIVNTTSNINAYGNIVKGSTAAGAYVKNTSSNTYMDTISIKSNHFIDNEIDGILVEAAGTNALIDILGIKDNVIKSIHDSYGIRVQTSVGAPAPKKIAIEGNTIIGKTGSTKAAFWTNASGFTSWDVERNKVYNHSVGVQLTSATIADKEIGTGIVFKGNKFKDVATAWNVNYAGEIFGFVYDTTYNNVTTRANNAGGVLDAINHGTFTEFSRSAIPTVGAWKLGDRLNFSSPTTHIGAVCTATGSPGTWKNFGAIS